MTAEEFWRSHFNGKHVELVRGEVEVGMPTSGDHGSIAANVCFLIKNWSRSHDGGWVGVESGFVVGRDPDTIRGPDVAYVQSNRVPPAGVPSYWQIPPDLAVEVVSVSETAQSVLTKVSEYLEAGTAEVWTIFPASRQVVVYGVNGIGRPLNENQELTSAILPGFSCHVADFFLL